MGDNYAPAVSQILLDAYLDEPYLFLPRMKLHIDTSGAGEISPYMNLLNNLFSAGTKSVQEVYTI